MKTVQSTGIYQKLIRVFILQMLFISVTTALGVYIAAIIVEKVMIRTALESEAAHYWQWLEQDSTHPSPNTYNLRGYVARNGDFSGVPTLLKPVQPGFGRVEMDAHDPIVYVEDRGADRLFLVFDEQSVRKLSFYFGVVPLSLALIVIYLSAWAVYKLSRRTLSPLVSLAQTMRNFDLSRHELDSLHLSDYTHLGVNDEVRVLADSLQEFTLRLKRQLQREREFTRDVSHELRTPLAVIQGSLELLVKQGIDARQQRAVERMQVTCRDMLATIETLLVLAREEGLQQTAPLVAVVSVSEQLLEQVAQTHNADQHVTLELHAKVDLQLPAPPQVVAIIIGNLLRNACNYTQSGTVRLSILTDAIVVSDTGMGMDAQDLGRAQLAFERLDDSVAGYGLGLDIVRRLCERYGWAMSIVSAPGAGTQVRVVFGDMKAILSRC